MSKRKKKQPYRNALLKTKKERDSLENLVKENHRLKASLLYKREEAQTLLHSAAQDKEQSEIILKRAEDELRKANPFHPMFMREKELSESAASVNMNYALTYRMTAPHLQWNEENNHGTIKFTCHKQFGEYETVGYGFTEAFIRDRNLIDQEEFMTEFSKDIARQLMELADEKLKEWYKNDKKRSHYRRSA